MEATWLIKVYKKGIIALIAGIAITAVLMMLTDFKSAFLRLVDISSTQGVLIFSFMPINYFIKYFREHYYLRLMGDKIRLVDEIFSLLSSFVMLEIPEKLGETFLSGYLLQKCGYKIGMLSIVSLTLEDYLTEGIAMAILVLLTVSSFNNKTSSITVVHVGIGLLLIGVVLQKEIWIMNGTSKIETIEKFAPVAQRCRRAYQETKVIYRSKTFLLSTAMGIVSWCCEGAVIYRTC